MTLGTDLTFLVAIAAGLISFLSPCVLPLVPAYLGQLTAVAVAATPGGKPPSRWIAVRHAGAYVLGFGTVFTLLGITATYAGGALGQWLPVLRQVGGVILIVMGLNLAGFLTIGRLERTWRPLDLGATHGRRRGDRRDGPPGPDPALAELRRPDRRAARGRRNRARRVVRARDDLRDRLDAMHRHDPRRHSHPGRDVRIDRARGPSCSSATRSGWGSRSWRSASCTTARRSSSDRSSGTPTPCRSSAACSWRRSGSRCSSTSSPGCPATSSS